MPALVTLIRVADGTSLAVGGNLAAFTPPSGGCGGALAGATVVAVPAKLLTFNRIVLNWHKILWMSRFCRHELAATWLAGGIYPGTRRMKRTLLLVGLAAVLFLTVIIVYGSGWFLASKPPAADDLEKAVLAGGDPVGQQKAAVDLIELGEPALPNVRRVLHESKSPEVRAIMIMGIAQMRDKESLEDIFKALDDDSYVVRVQALAAMRSIMFFDNIFKPDAPHEVRVEAIKKVRQQMAEMKKAVEREFRAGRGKQEKGQEKQ